MATIVGGCGEDCTPQNITEICPNLILSAIPDLTAGICGTTNGQEGRHNHQCDEFFHGTPP